MRDNFTVEQVKMGRPFDMKKIFVLLSLAAAVTNAGYTLNLFKDGTPIQRNRLLAQVPYLCSQYEVSFSVFPERFVTGWANVFHMTVGGNDKSYGDRTPAVWFGYTRTTRESRLYICSAVNGDPNYCIKSRKFYPVRKRLDVRIIQKSTLNGLLYSIYLNGELENEVINTEPKEFKYVKVYTSNNWYASQPGSIINIVIKNCLSNKYSPRPTPPTKEIINEVAKLCPKAKENGFCVLADGTDQKEGVIKLDDFDGKTSQRFSACLKKCSEYRGATGCEMIWDNWTNKGCYVHTKEVAKGNGVANHACWVFSNECKPQEPACTTKKVKEDGFCVFPDGADQNTGVIKLDDFDGKTPQRRAACLQKCSLHKGATGCEMIWDNWFNKGCYVHTAPVAKGNGNANHACWIFKKVCTQKPTVKPTIVPKPETPKIDIGFLIDASSSVSANFNQIKLFVKMFSTMANFGSDIVRGGVMSYCKKGNLNTKFDAHTSPDTFNAAVDKIKLIGGTKKLHIALRSVIDNMFVATAGVRVGVPKVLVLLVDNAPVTGQETGLVAAAVKIAAEVRKLGIHIVIVSVKTDLKFFDLGAIAGNVKNIVMPGSYAELVDIKTVKLVWNLVLSLVKPPPPPPPPKIDIGFLIDASSSVSANFNQIKLFVKLFSTMANFGSDIVRGGVMSYCKKGNLNTKFDAHASPNAFNAAVDKIKLIGGTKKLHIALRSVIDDMFVATAGVRVGVPKVLVLLVDNAPVTGQETGLVSAAVKIAAEVRKLGIHIVIVSVKTDLKFFDLGAIAGNVKNIVMPGSYAELVDIKTVKLVWSLVVSLVKLPLLPLPTLPPPPPPPKIDIGFLIDASSSVSANFKQIKLFVKLFSTMANFGSDIVRGGVMSYCKKGNLNTKFNAHTSPDAFNAAIDKIKLIGGTKKLHIALRSVIDNMFVATAGVRVGVPKVLVLLVDNAPVTGQETGLVAAAVKIAAEVRKLGIHIVIVSVKTDIKFFDLGAIAGNVKNIVMPGSYAELVDIKTVKLVWNLVLSLAKPPPPPPPPKIDIGFLIDASSSVSANFNQIKLFIKLFSTMANFGSDIVRGGVMSYCKKGNLNTKFDAHATPVAFNAAVDKIKLIGGTKKLHIALRSVIDDMFVATAGVRVGVPKVLVLLVDNAPVTGQETGLVAAAVKIAAEVRKLGIHIIIVSVKTDIKFFDLGAIAGNAKNVFLPRSYAELVDIKTVKLVWNFILGLVSKKPTLPPTIPATCPPAIKEDGFCVLADGTDQNEGVIKLDDFDGKTPQRFADCLKKCQLYKGATGCEIIYDVWLNKGCYVHTKKVAKGNGEANHNCWVFKGDPSCNVIAPAKCAKKKEKGFCVRSDGTDQNGGVIKLDGKGGNNAARQASCLAKCRAYGGATGCELVWGFFRLNKGCYVHTKEVAKGNGEREHVCWVLEDC